jgi:hypothetical protein
MALIVTRKIEAIFPNGFLGHCRISDAKDLRDISGR